MIYIERKITIKKNQAKIEQPIVLYKGDMNIELKFSIENNPFKHKSGTEATKGQLIIKRPKGEPIFSEPVKMSESKVIFIVTGDMIDGLDVDGNYTDETGAYDFQIQLLNEGESSIGSLPPVTGGIIIKEPLCERATVNATYVNKDNAYVMPANIATFSLRDSDDIFDEEGNYNKSMWVSGDIITDARLNRVEDALYEINDNIPTDYATREYVGDMIEANNDSIDNIYMKQAYMNNYASKEYVTESIDNIGLEDYASRDYVNDVITSNNANIEEYVDNAIENIEIPEAEVDLTGYATENYVDERLSNYAKLSYVDEVIANIDISGGGDIVVIDGVLDTAELNKDIWQSDTGITTKLVQMNDVSFKYRDADGEHYKVTLQGFYIMTYMPSESMLAINELQTTKVQLFMTGDPFVLLEEWYAWEDVEPEHEVATKSYVDGVVRSYVYGVVSEALDKYATQDYVNDLIGNINDILDDINGEVID